MVPGSRSWPAPRRLILDLANQKVLIFLEDGTLVAGAIPTELGSGWEGLAKSEADLDAGELTLTFSEGDSVSVDLGWPGVASPPAPVVYLDQNHWIALARAIHSPDRADSETNKAALMLIALARERTVRLPFSAGHLVETVPRGRQRRHIALTVLSLSRGLQMRNPLQVRRQELASAVAGHEPRCEVVFTTEPSVLFTEPHSVTPPRDFPAVWKQLHRRMTEMTATVAVMLDDDDTVEPVGPRERWLKGYQAVAAEVHSERRTPAQTRAIARGVLLSDLRDETVRAAQMVGRSADDLRAWAEDRAEDDLERAPHIATLLELLYQRLRNRDDHWVRNDLIDMHFLSCAGGYADLVVAERKFADYLRRARIRYPTNAAVAATLPEAVESLGSLHPSNDEHR